MRARTRRNRPTRSVGLVVTLVVAALIGVAANQMTATATPTARSVPAPVVTVAPTPPRAVVTPAPTPARTAPQGATAHETGVAAGRALAAQVTVDGVLAHLREFQKIADGNDGIRASGVGRGYARSADYVVENLTEAGYRVTRQKFEFPYFEEVRPTTFRRTGPTPRSYRSPADFQILSYSGGGTVEARVHPVDVALRPPRASTSGCETADFVGFPRGDIALLQRGSCDFSVKARHAVGAGAAGIVIFNQGDTKDRLDAFGGTLQTPFRIPAIAVSYAVGAELAASPRTRVRIETDTLSETRTTENVIADLPGQRHHHTVMVGAHLDSVPAGPGINDNGSGSAGVLEVALRYAELARRTPTPNGVRFAWWGAEEAGLLGSEHYVDALDRAQRRQIALYLNFDMIASPNYELGVYDGDNSHAAPGTTRGPAGSARIEKFFLDFLTERGQESTPSPFTGRSDYGPFIDNGIPAGGMDTGAEEKKTRAGARKFGGVPGVAFDPCYHQACDALTPVADAARRADRRKLADAYGSRLVGNINVVPLDLISDAIANAVGRYSYDVSDVVSRATPAP